MFGLIVILACCLLALVLGISIFMSTAERQKSHLYEDDQIRTMSKKE